LKRRRFFRPVKGSELAFRAEPRLAVDPKLHVDLVADVRDRCRRKVVDPEGAGGEADQREATLGDRPGRGAVAVDRAEDVDPVRPAAAAAAP
jgi:hypothetical protein